MALAVHMPRHQHAICRHMTRLCHPPANCREWKQACINTIHQPTVTGSHPPHDNHTGDYSPFSLLTCLLILLFFFSASCIHPSWLVTAISKFTSAQSNVLCSKGLHLTFHSLVFFLLFFLNSFTSYSFSVSVFLHNHFLYQSLIVLLILFLFYNCSIIFTSRRTSKPFLSLSWVCVCYVLIWQQYTLWCFLAYTVYTTKGPPAKLLIRKTCHSLKK